MRGEEGLGMPERGRCSRPFPGRRNRPCRGPGRPSGRKGSWRPAWRRTGPPPLSSPADRGTRRGRRGRRGETCSGGIFRPGCRTSGRPCRKSRTSPAGRGCIGPCPGRGKRRRAAPIGDTSRSPFAGRLGPCRTVSPGRGRSPGCRTPWPPGRRWGSRAGICPRPLWPGRTIPRTESASARLNCCVAGSAAVWPRPESGKRDACQHGRHHARGSHRATSW